MHNRYIKFNGRKAGTKYTLSPECRFVRGNPQWPEVLDLSRKPIII
jgi:hypothetical protein